MYIIISVNKFIISVSLLYQYVSFILNYLVYYSLIKKDSISEIKLIII